MKVIFGPSGSGKTSLVTKLTNLSTPLVHSGKIRRRYHATVALQVPNDETDLDQWVTVRKHVETMAILGEVKASQILYNLQKLGLGDVFDTRISKLLP